MEQHASDGTEICQQVMGVANAQVETSYKQLNLIKCPVIKC